MSEQATDDRPEAVRNLTVEDAWNDPSWKEAARQDHRERKAPRPGFLMSVDYRWGELRCALLRARLIENELTPLGLALKAGLLSPDEAIEEMKELQSIVRLIDPLLPVP